MAELEGSVDAGRALPTAFPAGQPVTPAGAREADGNLRPSASTSHAPGTPDAARAVYLEGRKDCYRRFAGLRDKGYTAAEAGAALGISRETRRRYDVRWSAARGVKRVDRRLATAPARRDPRRLPARFNDHEYTAIAMQPLAPWMRSAACLGLPMEAPARMSKESAAALTAEALAVCAACRVRVQCERWVLALEEELDPGGVCAGLTVEDRRRARRARTLAATAKPGCADA